MEYHYRDAALPETLQRPIETAGRGGPHDVRNHINRLFSFSEI